ncbi:unnamed protein product [Paramecium sonneborni]|uniref:Uncharacterized protein n=1 Tax=Paramecium sonneborni TaxID=65129 RepID=A0A8S1RVB0_9CILI|nr:unnamed protein product [Paramecium sonneborni]
MIYWYKIILILQIIIGSQEAKDLLFLKIDYLDPEVAAISTKYLPKSTTNAYALQMDKLNNQKNFQR